jgi:hypothetical protein
MHKNYVYKLISFWTKIPVPIALEFPLFKIVIAKYYSTFDAEKIQKLFIIFFT